MSAIFLGNAREVNGALGKFLVGTYYIRTMIAPDRTSLISTAHHTTDIAAIGAARMLLRNGETLEVWRDDTLVYRYASTGVASNRPRRIAATHLFGNIAAVLLAIYRNHF